jgi:hypothetical protein
MIGRNIKDQEILPITRAAGLLGETALKVLKLQVMIVIFREDIRRKR